MMLAVAAVLYFFAFLFNMIVPGLPPGTRDGALLTVWFCIIFGSGFLLAGVVLFPRWAKELFSKKKNP